MTENELGKRIYGEILLNPAKDSKIAWNHDHPNPEGIGYLPILYFIIYAHVDLSIFKRSRHSFICLGSTASSLVIL